MAQRVERHIFQSGLSTNKHFKHYTFDLLFWLVQSFAQANGDR